VGATRARSKLSEGLFRYSLQKLVDYIFREKHPGLRVMRFGGLLLSPILAGVALDLAIPTEHGSIKFSFSTEEAIGWLQIGIVAFSVLLISIGLVWRIRDEIRRRVIAIELRGLRDSSGRPLMDAIPRRMIGHRDQLLIDVRQGQDGRLSEPQAALGQITSLPISLSQRVRGLNRSDISIVLGGLGPVPFCFLVGVLLDDEDAITFMDWNRHIGSWLELTAPDDGKRFLIEGLDAVHAGTPEVSVAVSVSYNVEIDKVQEKFPHAPLIKMTLDEGDTEAHWSETKQIALGRQFLNTMIQLANKNVRCVHLFLAAPASIAFRFGRLYDKRNLPAVIVYQYAKGQEPRYPWGVRMPVESVRNAEIVS